MKQLLSLSLFLLPCLAWAQYPSNGNQKITLGEQTTADGLIYRGVAATDTVRKPSIDTMAYMVLDTTTNIIWHYKKATSNAWLRLNLLPSDTASMLTPYWRAGRFSGVLPVANGGTGATIFTAGRILFGNGTNEINTSSNLFWNNTNIRLGIGATPIASLDVNTSDNTTAFFRHTNNDGGVSIWNTNTLAAGQSSQLRLANGSAFFSGNNPAWQISAITTSNGSSFKYTYFYGNVYSDRFVIDQNGFFGMGISVPTEKLHVVGNARITAMNGIGDIGADANGVLQAATSDMNLKNTIENSPFGLNEILLLNPVTFFYNDTDRKIDSDVKEVGFIAQDVFDIIPNAVSSTGTGDLQLDYRAITATLVKAIQEQQALIKALEQRIINLENK
jgi:hypothetical protein